MHRQQLLNCVLECSPLAHWGRNHFALDGWDSLGFATNLPMWHGHLGSNLGNSLSADIDKAIQSWPMHSKRSAQALCHDAIVKHNHKICRKAWRDTLSRWLNKFGIKNYGGTEPAWSWLETRLLLLDNSCVLMLVRTLSNYSATWGSHGSETHGCFLGCSHLTPLRRDPLPFDSLSHHLCCPILRLIIEHMPGFWGGIGPFTRVGIAPQAIDLRLLAAGHITYNVLRHHGL